MSNPGEPGGRVNSCRSQVRRLGKQADRRDRLTSGIDRVPSRDIYHIIEKIESWPRWPNIRNS